MPQDKSLWYYGATYSRLVDPEQAEYRQVAVDLIPEGASVLDIGCGTGLLCGQLRKQKQCRVVGLDLSLRMLEFARKANPFQDVAFVHGDATDLRGFGDQSFDYAAMVILLHELPRSTQARVLGEALRVARRAIIVDSAAPLPRNFDAVKIHFGARVRARSPAQLQGLPDRWRGRWHAARAGVAEVVALGLQTEDGKVYLYRAKVKLSSKYHEDE